MTDTGNQALYGSLGTLGVTGALVGGIISLVQARRARKERAKQEAAAQALTQKFLSSTGYQGAKNFVEQFYQPAGSKVFGTDQSATPAVDMLTENYSKGLRAAQAARGLFESPAAGAAEASGLSAYRANMAADLLPQLQALEQAPISVLNMARNTTYNRGPDPLTALLSGATQGGAAGAALGIDLSQYQGYGAPNESLYVTAPMVTGRFSSPDYLNQYPRSQRF